MRKVRKACHGCKRFQTMAYAAPSPGNLPTTRTRGPNPYQVVGIDSAGPIRYGVSEQREGKACVFLYACSLTRGVFLNLSLNLEMAVFKELKEIYCAPGEPPTRIMVEPLLVLQSEGQTTRDLPLHQSDQMAVQRQSCTVVGRTV